jgi:3-carboxy-cis,cis-muconate cycloisomerase
LVLATQNSGGITGRSTDVFDAIFVPAEFREAVSDRAWLQAMLDVERALAVAEARAGVIPPGAAEAIAAACEWERFDPAELAEQGRAPGNPVEPLVRALTEAVEGDAARYVHWGATSQDILDTAAMLISRTALGLLLDGVAQVAAECSALAEAHRETPMAARTLLQQAVPTTFGLKAAGWLVAVLEARRGLLRARENLATQLGGAAGTLAPLGDAGAGVSRLFAEELGLHEPTVPWHTNRVRIAELGAALAITAGVLAKVGVDVALMAQTEVSEVAEAEGGVSSTMPQKRNPVGSALAIACARQVEGHVSVLIAALPQEHERALGGWHSEWPALSGALAYTGGAAEAVRRALDGLEVDTERMRANLEQAGGAVMAEQASFVLAEQIGRREAHERVAQALASGEGLAEDLDPASYLGSAEEFVDRALAAYREEVG